MLTFTLWASLDLSVTLKFMPLNWGRKPEKEHPDSSQPAGQIQELLANHSAQKVNLFCNMHKNPSFTKFYSKAESFNFFSSLKLAVRYQS